MYQEANYFAGEKKGDIHELREELRGERKERKKDALKRIISNMTIGKDMSDLFTEVVNLIQTDNKELKKLVYLYLINYSRSKPDLALLAVNTFVKDCEDPNPLVRALAVRTMGCIRVPNINEYLCEPLRKCLRDEDPYVRKTAAICVLKLFHFDPSLAIDQGFVEQLNDLLKDPNPMVLTNALAALVEIALSSPEYMRFLALEPLEVSKLLTALNECTEWGQIVILDALINYEPDSENEAQSICERVTSRLSHANSAVVLSTTRLLLKMVSKLGNEHPMSVRVLEKLGPPLVTMLSIAPELQYVALRNINLIVQKYPSILKDELKFFFLKYNDPAYIKIEKLAIMIKLVSDDNVDTILAELKEYASEVDVDIVRKSVRAIGTCALRVDSAADRCVRTLLDLIHTKVSYVVQEGVIVARDIMRKYPGRYESLIETLGDNLFTLDDPDARAALIWIMGEYADRIENAADVLKHFVDSFLDESANVQLQLLTAVVKLFLRRPAENQQLVENVLTTVTQQIDNPDIRDRGFFYWRLLSADPSAAKEIVLAPKPVISPESDNLDPAILEELLLHLSSLSSVYHKLPRLLTNSTKRLKEPLKKHLEKIADNGLDSDTTKLANTDQQQITSASGLELLDFDFSEPAAPLPPSSTPNNFDLLSDIFSSINVGQPQQIVPSSHLTGLFSETPQTNQNLHVPPLSHWLLGTLESPLEISGQFLCSPSLRLSLNFENKSVVVFIFSNPSIRVENNYFGLRIIGPNTFPSTLASMQKATTSINLDFAGLNSPTLPVDYVHFSLECDSEVLSFSAVFPFHYYFQDFKLSAISQEKFLQLWDSVPQANHKECTINNWALSAPQTQSRLESLNIYSLTSTSPNCVAGHCVLKNNVVGLLKLSIESLSAPKCTIASSSVEILDALSRLLSNCLDAPFNL